MFHGEPNVYTFFYNIRAFKNKQYILEILNRFFLAYTGLFGRNF